jgi:hypothetical protein
MVSTEELEFAESSLRESEVLRRWTLEIASTFAVESKKHATARTAGDMPIVFAATLALVLVAKVGVSYLRSLADLDLVKRQVKLVDELVDEGCPRDKAEKLVFAILTEIRKQPSEGVFPRALAALAQSLADISMRKSHMSQPEGAAGSSIAKPPSEAPLRPSFASEVIELLSNYDSISLDEFRVVGHYYRFTPTVVTSLKRFADKIIRDCRGEADLYHNFLIWGSSGDGKTYFATEIAISTSIQHRKISLASATDVPTEAALKEHLAQALAKRGPYLYIIDEVDKRTEPWVCSALFDALSSRKGNPTGNTAFVLIGSTGESLEDFWSGIEKKTGGKDLRTRVPDDQSLVIPTNVLGDRLVVILGQIQYYALKEACEITRIDKLALAFLLLSPSCAKPRGIERLVSKAVGRSSGKYAELRLGHFYSPEDETSAQFIYEFPSVYEALRHQSLRVQ